MFWDLIKGGLDSEAGVFKSAVGRQHSDIEQNFDIEAKVLNVGVYLISGYRCVCVAWRLPGLRVSMARRRLNWHRSVIPQDARSQSPYFPSPTFAFLGESERPFPLERPKKWAQVVHTFCRSVW